MSAEPHYLARRDEEAAVREYLARVPKRLADATEANAPYWVANIRKETSQVYAETVHNRMSMDLRMDAQEMTRWCEWHLGRAIKEGQENGTVAPPSQARGGRSRGSLPRPNDIIGQRDVVRSEIYVLAGLTHEQFEQALAEARLEGNLGRKHMADRIRRRPITQIRAGSQKKRAEAIALMAKDGKTRQEIADHLGIKPATVTKIASAFGVSLTGQPRTSSVRIVDETVRTLEDLRMGLLYVKYSDLSTEDAAAWSESLTESLRVFNRFNNKIKERLEA